VTSSASNYTVLVVDDTASNRMLYGTLLTRAGYNVRVASSGAEALQQIEAQVPSLVLLDFMMPGMDGAEVLSRLRKSATTMELPVVVLTASVASDDIERALVSGADDYITKPVDSRILLTRIKSIIRAHEDRARASAEPQRNALLQELEEARAVQRAQLPQVPQTWPGWHMVGAVVPSGQIAGDIFDIVHFSDDRAVAMLVDVSGHGAASALVAAATRTALRELLVDRNLEEAMRLLNVRMTERETGKYSCVGAVEVRGRDVTVVNIGLPPIVAQRNGRNFQSIVGSGFPIGLFPDSQYRATSFSVSTGDLIILVSDGLTEPFGATDDVESALVRMNIQEDCPPSTLGPDELQGRVREATKTPLPEMQDDATVVFLEAV
jgi:sigma-B regulation protein RsbU (phosphoserine phosphatase)